MVCTQGRGKEYPEMETGLDKLKMEGII